MFEGEVSRWSSDSREYDLNINERDVDSDENEPEIKDIVMETTEEKLARHRRFFQGEPLIRCLREEEESYQTWMETIFFENLYHEVRYGLQETRSQEEVRSYWKDVRDKLRIDDSEIDSSTLITERLDLLKKSTSYMGSVIRNSSSTGWKRPNYFCETSGKDLELLEIRNFLIDKKTTLRELQHVKTLFEEIGDAEVEVCVGRKVPMSEGRG